MCFQKALVLFCAFFDWPAFLWMFFWPLSTFFPKFGKISIKMVIFVHFKHVKINTSELSSDYNSQNASYLLLKPFVPPEKSKGKMPQNFEGEGLDLEASFRVCF